MKTFWLIQWTISIFITRSSLSNAASADWKLVWADEFDGDTINQNHWNFELEDGCQISNEMCGWGNKELQWYTNTSENAFVANGHLIIQARRENTKDRPYTSARMFTLGKGDWLFGRVEIRAKFPSGKGILPLIFMLPSYEKYGIWPASGEIDIASGLEVEKGNLVDSLVQVGAFDNELSTFKKRHYTKQGEPKFSDDFHTFALEKNVDDLTWYINDRVAMKYQSDDSFPYIYPFNERFHIVLSMAVGGLTGSPEKTPFPKRMEIDYVRVYIEK